MLIAATEVIDGFERMGGIGTVKGELHIDWAALQRHKRSFTDPVPGKREQAYAEQGIDAYHGRARFSGPDTVVVGGKTLKARHIVIAAGAEPVRLPIEGAEHLALSDDFLNLESLPRRIVLIGGGYIGFAFAHIAARVGASVTVLNRGPRPLTGFDPDLVALLVERTRTLGVDVRLGHEVKAVRKCGDGFEVEAQGRDGRIVIETDLVIHSGGRAPALEALDPDAAGIAHDKGRLTLDKTFRSTSNPAVYVAGDAAGGPLPLTPVAALEAHALVHRAPRQRAVLRLQGAGGRRQRTHSRRPPDRPRCQRGDQPVRLRHAQRTHRRCDPPRHLHLPHRGVGYRIDAAVMARASVHRAHLLPSSAAGSDARQAIQRRAEMASKAAVGRAYPDVATQRSVLS